MACPKLKKVNIDRNQLGRSYDTALMFYVKSRQQKISIQKLANEKTMNRQYGNDNIDFG